MLIRRPTATKPRNPSKEGTLARLTDITNPHALQPKTQLSPLVL
jgi:hypothetical protein